MHLEYLREYCLSKKAVEETLPFGPDTLVFKIMGKAFLLCGFENDPLSFNVKCDPEKAIELREEFPCVQPGYHMNKKHWNTISADGSVKGKKEGRNLIFVFSPYISLAKNCKVCFKSANETFSATYNPSI
jgi:predicted DNA-binding protein (MmcQ/YjbR family)